MNEEYVYVVEQQSPYDGGGVEKVFKTFEAAALYCESNRDSHIRWDMSDPDYVTEDIGDEDDFYYVIIKMELLG